MTNSDDTTKTPHAHGSQPSTRPGSDEPQTITAPTPPVGQSSEPPEEADVTDEDERAEQPGAGGNEKSSSSDD
ncbi:hypothetical protein [Streptomyces sp. CA-111067]|uniref:hypothetical protein n=1 Tax=Streptomyces sp. CA-111067 TaxID=3240046 RepID=UPI003D95B217